MEQSAFSGTKIALLCANKVVAYQRDNNPRIPFAGLWDLPGGGREGAENPVACALREVEEEFGIAIDEGRVRSLRRYESKTAGGLDTCFCVAEITPSEIGAIRFGNEGQRWRLMDVALFIVLADAVPDMKMRLKHWLDSQVL